MIPRLNAIEVRVLGCLMEKAIFTPEVYPLTLNSLVLACNQKSSRDPQLNLSPTDVQRAARDLEGKALVKREENFRNGVEKYQQRFCNTAFGSIQLSPAEYALMTLLLLRGAQTPGELKSRSGRLHEFTNNAEVISTLQAMIDREGGPLVARLARKPNRQDHEYVHLLEDVVESVAQEVSVHSTNTHSASDRTEELEARIAALETQVAELKQQLGISE